MRRQLAAVGATLTASCLILAGTGSVASAATAQTSQSNAALRYLYAHVGADGSIAGDLGATEDAVISVADGGYDPATMRNATTAKSVYDFMSSKVGTIATAGGAAKYVLAWVAAGKPAAIDASALLVKLNTPVASSGYLEPNGAFHNSNGLVETANAYTQSLAVLAEMAAQIALPANATGWLTCAQRPDGGFGYAIDDSLLAPPAFCGDTFGSDTNDTAIIVQALGAAGVTSANAAVETYLHSVQLSTGGFAFSGTGPSDPSSDQGVIDALVAIGQDPSAAAWTKGGGNAPTDLVSFADPKGTGGFIFPGNSGPDAFTTSAIPQGLLLTPYSAHTKVAPGTTPFPAPAPVTPTPGGVLGITVPDTGASAGDGGGVLVVLLAAGAALLATVLVGRRPSTEP